MTNSPTILAALAVLLVAGCAQQPDSIPPASMPAAMYAATSCTEAAVERGRVANTLASLESQQRSAVAGDAVGVFLIGVPVSSLAGGDKAGLLAVEKGKLLSIDARLAECNRAPA